MLSDEELDSAADEIEGHSARLMNCDSSLQRHEAVLIAGSTLLARARRNNDQASTSHDCHKCGMEDSSTINGSDFCDSCLTIHPELEFIKELQEALVNHAILDFGFSKDEIYKLNKAFELSQKGLRGPALLLLCEVPDIMKDRHGGEYKAACEMCRTCIKMDAFFESSRR